MFLTYDDGPNPSVTPKLLDILKESRTSATFFVTGESLAHTEAPSILRRMVAEGHTIGNHGQLHLKTEYPGYEISQRRIETACGIRTGIFRAPYGLKRHVADYLRKDRRVLGVHWTVYFEDWLPLDFEKVARQIRELEPGSILLLHDGAASGDEYRDRSQVLKLTEMIIAECHRRSIPLAGLASIYPALHRTLSDSARKRDFKHGNRSSSVAKSITVTFSVFKQWCGMHWM
jgi:peptidoglycan/xylan/chitin deacetylase (PgdA/CDA1 family)